MRRIISSFCFWGIIADPLTPIWFPLPMVPGPLPKLYFLCEGSTELGSEIWLLTPEGKAGSWGACKCSCLYFLMGGGLCTLCVMHTGREPGICCCFYGTTDSLCAPPTASVWLADCVCVCVSIMRAGVGVVVVDGGVPLCPCAWLCFAISSLRGWCLWKRIWISSQFKAGERTRGWLSQRRFQE